VSPRPQDLYLPQRGDEETNDLRASAMPSLSIAVVSRSPRPAVSPNPSYVFPQSWKSEMGMFHYPSGIAVAGDHVYVCDTYSDRVQVFDPYSTPLTTFGGHGSGNGQFDDPTDITVDRSGNIQVPDRINTLCMNPLWMKHSRLREG
jgi:DNA-binding beta-propeller fold protein YncE